MTEQNRAVFHLQNLIRCPSVTPEEGGAISYLEQAFNTLGFETHRVTFKDENTPDIENLYARIGTSSPNICFAGHTDVVPTGDAQTWKRPPFSGEIIDGTMYGRGAVDMKGGIACFLAAVENYLSDIDRPAGSISFLITGDEEGPAINGTKKLLEWITQKGETIDACIVGEPTNPDAIGDAIKIGRRGSLSGRVTVCGVQGHTAYPHLADNPVRGLTDILTALLGEPFDQGTESFQPSNLEVNSVDVGNPTVNVIPAKASATFNIRFNDTWTADSVREEIMRRVDEGAGKGFVRKGKSDPAQFEIEWIGNVSHVFLTEDAALIETLADAVEAQCGRRPQLSTGGGTSDARFIKDYCPVVEFGLVGQTMHKIDERTPVSDLEKLTAIYHRFLTDYLS